MKKKKVLFFIPGGVGGAERVTITIAKMLPTDEFEVKYVIIDKSIGSIIDFIPAENEVRFIRFRNIWAGTCFKIAKMMKLEHADYAFCSLGHLSPHVLIGARIVGNIKTIIRNDNYVSTCSSICKIIRKITYRWAHTIISQQEEMRKDYIKTLNLDENKNIVIHNPIDVSTITQKLEGATSPYPNNDDINYLWVGRFDSAKGQDILVLAFAIVAQKERRANLYLVGSYKENVFFKRIKQFILNAGIEDRVHIIGYDANPYRWMKFCDCFVLPSRREGLPNAMVEAMYLGRPVVATNCLPIIGQMIDEGRNGFIVPLEDSESMAKAMINAYRLTDLKMKYEPGKSNDFINVF